MVIRTRMILSETRTTSNTFSHHSSARRTPNSTSALVISRPKEFEARVFSNYLLNAFHFPPGLLETTQVHSSPRHCLHHFTCFLLHRAHIKCANTKRFWAFAGFATRARPCSSTPPKLPSRRRYRLLYGCRHRLNVFFDSDMSWVYVAWFYDQDALPFSQLGHFTAVQELRRSLLTWAACSTIGTIAERKNRTLVLILFGLHPLNFLSSSFLTKSCPLFNFWTVPDIFIKLHTNIKHQKMTCRVQEP